MALKNEHTLMLVDDEKAIIKSLQRLFRKEGYQIVTAESGRDALEKLKHCEQGVSMIISDQRMPEMNGAQFLEKAKVFCPDAIRYLLTGYSDMEAVIQAVNKGEIHRYLTKPWNDDDLLLQVRQSLEHFELVSENRRLTELTIRQNRELNALNKNLERKVRDRTQEVLEKNDALASINRMLEKSFMDAIRLLVSLVEMLNPRLGQQMRNTAQLARQVGEVIGLPQTDLDQIEMAGLIHDIGLLGFPDELWEKEPQQLNDDQFRMFSEHPVIASIILEKIEKLADVGEIVLHHHEHVNGQGFPNGFKNDQIPLGSRILLAASDYCHIVATWPRDMQKLISWARRHFDPETWKGFTVSQDPETIIEEVAEKKLLLEAGQKYDVDVLTALIKALRKAKNIEPTMVVDMQSLAAGMVLMEDLRLNDGRLLLTRGTRLKAKSVASIISIAERGMIPNRLTVSGAEKGK